MDRTNITYQNLMGEFAPAVRQMLQAGRTFRKSLQSILLPLAENYFSALSSLAFAAQVSAADTDGETKRIGVMILRITRVYKEAVAQLEKLCKIFEDEFLNPVEKDLAMGLKKYGAMHKKFKSNAKTIRKPVERLLEKKQKERKKYYLFKNNTRESERLQIIAECEQRLREFEQVELIRAQGAEREAFKTILEHLLDVTSQTAIVVEGANTAFAGLSSTVYKENGMNGAGSDEHVVPSGERRSSLAPELLRRSRSTSASSSHGSSSSLSSRQQSRQTKYLKSGKALVQASLSFKSATNLPATVEVTPLHFPATSEDFSRRSSIRSQNRRATVTGVSFVQKLEIDTSEQPRARTAVFSFKAQNSQGSREQLNFEAGDKLVSSGSDPTGGWQYGKNLTTNQYGWFPVAFTELPGEADKQADKGEAEAPAEENTQPADPPHDDDESNHGTHGEYSSLPEIPLASPAEGHGNAVYEADPSAEYCNSAAPPAPPPPPVPQVKEPVSGTKSNSAARPSSNTGMLMSDVFAELKAKTQHRHLGAKSLDIDDHSSSSSSGIGSKCETVFPEPPLEFLSN